MPATKRSPRHQRRAPIQTTSITGRVVWLFLGCLERPAIKGPGTGMLALPAGLECRFGFIKYRIGRNGCGHLTHNMDVSASKSSITNAVYSTDSPRRRVFACHSDDPSLVRLCGFQSSGRSSRLEAAPVISLRRLWRRGLGFSPHHQRVASKPALQSISESSPAVQRSSSTGDFGSEVGARSITAVGATVNMWSRRGRAAC
jgi:hypothetical protein